MIFKKSDINNIANSLAELAFPIKVKGILKKGHVVSGPKKTVGWKTKMRDVRLYTPNRNSLNTPNRNSLNTPNRNSLNRFLNTNMDRVYSQSSFNRVNVPGNGSCFYHAVLLAGLGMEPVRGGNYVRNLRIGVRQQIRNYYRNYTDNQHVATTGNGAPITKRQFINSLNNMGCSASTAEVMAAARVLNRRIVCLCASPGNNSTYRVYPPFTIISYYNTLNSRNSIRLPPENPIYVYYDGYFKKKNKANRTKEEIIVSGAHFQSLIPKRP